jgi:hypothetical protein
MFDAEVVPEELTQVRMGKIVKEKFPELEAEDSGGGSSTCHRCVESNPTGKEYCHC